MGTTIRPDQLASEVMKGLEEYKDLAVDVMKKEKASDTESIHPTNVKWGK